MNTSSTDPVEAIIGEALDAAGIGYVGEHDPLNSAKLDFYLPAEQLYIECKRMPTDRTVAQLQRADDVIVVQGLGAAQWLAERIVAAAE